MAVKLGLLDAPPLRLAGLRFVIGGTLILAWAWATGRLAAFRMEPGEWRPLAVVALLLTVQVGSMNIGIGLTSAAHAAVMINLYAVHTVVLAHFMIPGDRLTASRVGGVLVAYSGIVVLFARQLHGGATTLPGDAVVFVSALLLGGRTVYMARAVQRLDPLKLILAQVVAGGAPLLLFSLLLEPRPTAWTLRLGGVLAYQGLFITAFNFAVNLWLLKRHRPSALAGFFLTQPLFGVIAAALFAGDPLTWELLVASVAVAIGIGLTTR